MPYSRQICCLLFLVTTALGWTANETLAQGSTESMVRPAGNSRQLQAKDIQFASKFWDYLLTNNYKHWSPPAEKSTGFFRPQILQSSIPNPHGDLSKLFVNRKAASNLNAPPVGSVLVMENYRSDKSLDSISVMYRTTGFNPNANDWFWANYGADGNVSAQALMNRFSAAGADQTFAGATKSKKLAGRVDTCIRCHSTAGADFVFFNSQNRSFKMERAAEKPPGAPVTRLGLKQ